ncbi:MAG TPA: HU family DNA-binding protein [bacterium]|jgi:DNA-binding protein HU-beta|nr:HU family DNA-binding protein [bacterium]
MNREQLIRDVARQSRVSRKDAEDALETMVEVIVKALRRGEEITVPGIGTFRTRRHAVAGKPRDGGRPGPSRDRVVVFIREKGLATRARG